MLGFEEIFRAEGLIASEEEVSKEFEKGAKDFRDEGAEFDEERLQEQAVETVRVGWGSPPICWPLYRPVILAWVFLAAWNCASFQRASSLGRRYRWMWRKLVAHGGTAAATRGRIVHVT